MTAIRVRGLSHFFGSGAIRKQVLADIDVRIGSGELAIMTGPSGSGKTTLLTVCGGLRSPQEGSAIVLGQELNGMPPSELVSMRRRLGFIFQMHNLFDSLTAVENVRMSLELHGVVGPEARQRAVEILSRLGLADRVDYRPPALSGGQRQRVAIARALVNRPRLVLADEPTAALDGASSQEVVRLLRQLAAEEGSAVLMVTHDARLLDAADRIVTLVDGRIASDVETNEAIRLCEFLKRCPVFDRLSPTELVDLSERFELEQVEGGATILRQGDPGEKFYVVRSGQVKVVTDDREVGRLATGEFFGELALVTGEPRSATVLATEAVELYSLGREDFRRILASSETFEQQLRKVAFQRT